MEFVDKQSEAAAGPAMSEFEVVTAMAFAAFADAPINRRRRGRHGRPSNTTQRRRRTDPVITPIGVDHTEYLALDRRSRAEKAGIMAGRTRSPRRQAQT